jgi:hypothetical protein
MNKLLAISSSSFCVPAIVAIFYSQWTMSLCMSALVVTSVLNHGYGKAKTIDRILARLLTAFYTVAAFYKGGGLIAQARAALSQRFYTSLGGISLTTV